MGIDAAGSGSPMQHVSLHEAAALARGLAFQGTLPGGLTTSSSPPAPPGPTARRTTPAASAGPAARRSFAPHTPVTSRGDANPDQYDAMLNRVGRKYNVPPLFLKAVMLAESGARSDAVGDSGHSVGLFQLHDHGYGAGMGDSRFDPETNADRAAQGLSEAWHAGQRKGYTGEQAVRAAYDYSFNPGGGWAYQGDSVVRNYDQLLREQGQPPLT